MLSTNQVLAGFGLIVVLAVGSQVLGSRLRVPALIIMVPAGLIAGGITSDVNPHKLPGPGVSAAGPAVVAVILYLIDRDKHLKPVTTSLAPTPAPGDTVVVLGPEGA